MSEADVQESHDEGQSGPSVEERAERMGWTPKDKFKGDPGKWIDAETFVQRGEEFVPFLKANNKSLEKSLHAAEARIKDFEKTLKEFGEYHSRTEQRAYAAALRELESRQDRAVAEGDTNAVRQITREIAQLDKEVRQEAPTTPNGWTPDYAEAVAAFKSANPWFEDDTKMTRWAKATDMELAETGMEEKARLKEIARQARIEFPDKFENPNRKGPGAVEGGSGVGTRRSAGKGWSDLPPEAKAQADSFVKKIPGFTREKYVKEFFSE